jgi:hypothetical protein
MGLGRRICRSHGELCGQLKSLKILLFVLLLLYLVVVCVC